MSDTTTASAEGAVRPFRIEVPQGEIDELRRRVNATRWPAGELVTDRSQGVQLAAIQNLARYWTTDYEWRRCEARLNALPQPPPNAAWRAGSRCMSVTPGSTWPTVTATL